MFQEKQENQETYFFQSLNINKVIQTSLTHLIIKSTSNIIHHPIKYTT